MQERASDTHNHKESHHYDIEARKSYLRIGEDDARRMQNMEELAEKNVEHVVEQLYEHMLSFGPIERSFRANVMWRTLKSSRERTFSSLCREGTTSSTWKAVFESVGLMRGSV